MIGHLANHLWQSTFFAVAAGLLALACRGNRAQVRYWLWFGASLKFLLPFALLMSLGNWLERAPVSGRLAKRVAAPAIASRVEQITQPFLYPAGPAGTAAPERPGEWLGAIAFVAWMGGFGILLRLRLRDWRRVRAAVRASTALELPGLEIPAGLRIRASPGWLEPGVIGFTHPVLLLPSCIAARLTPRQLETVLAHEMCHLRRRDNFHAAVHMLVEAIFWFYPLVWWIGARLVEERERACDEAVLQLGREPREYAEAILGVCRLYAEAPRVCMSGIAGSNLRMRLHAILAERVGRDLSFAKKAALAAAALTALTGPVVVGMMGAPRAQAQARATPKFEVASVKPCRNEPGRRRGSGEFSPGRLSTGCDLLVDANNLGLIQRAYVRFAGGHANPLGVLAIQGGPGWIHSEMFEINAKAETGTSPEMMQGPLLQALLEDRFRLKIHRATREGPVYALTPVKDESKLKPFPEGSCRQMPLTFPVPAPGPGERYCNVRIRLQPPSVDAEGSTPAEFAKLLNLVLDRPVVDRTGIGKRFNIHLEFSRDEATPGLRGPVPEGAGAAAEPAVPGIFTAIREQLGWKLVPAKGPIEVLVIDHIERPSEN